MPCLRWRRDPRAARLVFALSVAVLGCCQAEDEKPPELDIVVTTKMKSTKEHLSAYVGNLQRDVSTVFTGLRTKVWQVTEKPEDGASKYRMVIEHSGTIMLGSEIKNTRKTMAGGNSGDVWTRDWILEGHQQGTLAFKFLRWEDTQYKEIDKWTIPVPKTAAEEECKGFWSVATRSGRGKSADDVAQSPITPDDAKKNVLQSLLPGSIRELVLSRLFKVTVTKIEKSKQDPTGFDATINVKNLSPWDIENIDATTAFQGSFLATSTRAYRQEAGGEDTKIAAGKEKNFILPGREMKGKVPVGVTNVQFKAAE